MTEFATVTDQATPRFAMPLLAGGQAGKEIAHNEALSLIDLLLQPVVEAMGTDVPPANPALGRCWVVGTAPTAAWLGRAGSLAGWTEGGWCFAHPVEGFSAWCSSSRKPIAYRDGLWQESDVVGTQLTIAGQRVVGPRQPAIADPGGGDVIDPSARSAVAAILTAMRQHGLIAS